MTPTGPVTPGELERLAKFSEECAEGIQVVNKIILHGFVAVDERGDGKSYDNRADLEKEMGDIFTAGRLLMSAGDVNPVMVAVRIDRKSMTITDRMYHQAADALSGVTVTISKVNP